MDEENIYDFNIYNYTYEDETPFYPEYNYSHEIRLSVFFISAVCVGAPCLIWAFYLVHLQRKTRHQISAFIILLLIIDLLQLVLYPYIVSELYLLNGSFLIVIGYVYLKTCGLHLQQLVTLEAVLTLKYPHISAHIFSLLCYIVISIIILLFPLMCILFAVFGDHKGLYLIFGSVLAPVYLLVVTGIITYKASPTSASTSVIDNRPYRLIFLVSMITSTVLYLPSVVSCVLFSPFHLSKTWFVMCQFVEFDSDFRACPVCADVQRKSQNSEGTNPYRA